MVSFWQFITHYWAALAITATCLSLLTFVLLVLTKYVRICLNIFSGHPPSAVHRLQGLSASAGRGGPLSQFRRDKSPRNVVKGDWRFRKQRDHRFSVTSSVPTCTVAHGTPVRSWMLDSTYSRSISGGTATAADRPTIECCSGLRTRNLKTHWERAPTWKTPSCRRANRRKSGIFGISRGAGAAIMTACSDRNIACIVCDGAFSTAETLVTLMKKWASIFGAGQTCVSEPPRFILELSPVVHDAIRPASAWEAISLGKKGAAKHDRPPR